MHVAVDTIIRYPDTQSQSFLFPKALDAEAVLGRRSHIGRLNAAYHSHTFAPTPSSLAPPAMDQAPKIAYQSAKGAKG